MQQEPLVKDKRWTTFDEVNFIRSIGSDAMVNCSRSILLEKYLYTITKRVFWGEIDRGIAQKCAEDELTKEIAGGYYKKAPSKQQQSK